jgi:hypothetical protein
MSSPVKINDLRPVFSLEKTKCREQDSNLHTLRYQILSLDKRRFFPYFTLGCPKGAQ